MPRIENSSGESIPDILIIAWGPFSLFLFSNFTDFFLGAVLNPVLSYPPFPKEWHYLRQRIKLKNIQATPVAQFQKNK